MERASTSAGEESEAPAEALRPPSRPSRWDEEPSTLKRLAAYPFLPEAARYVGAQRAPLQEILVDRAFDAARRRAVAEVYAGLETGELPDEPFSSTAESISTLYAYPLGRMLVSCVGDPFLIRRYALALADRARRHLDREEDPFLLQVCEAMKLDCYVDGGYHLHFTDFLRATRGLRGKEWKLINQPVEGGYVQLGRERFLRVLEGHLRGRFAEELPLEVNDLVLEAFRGEAADLQSKLRERRYNLASADLGAARVTNFPPCMQKLLGAVLASENVSHPGRFALVSFMNNVGLDFDAIYQVFASVPDFRESVTRYQIEHITGKISGTEYTAPECSTMKSYGICPGPDRLCQTITHPLGYYRKKSRHRSRAKQPSPKKG